MRSSDPRSLFHHWFVTLEPDGRFRISGVPPGEYFLSFAIYAKPEGCLVHPLGRRSFPIKITEEDAKRGMLSLGEIDVSIDPGPGVGESPDIKFLRLDGSLGKLADFRGRLTLVHFWASWCGPCKKDLPELKRTQQKWPDQIQLLGVAVEDDADSWAKASQALELPWLQGRVEKTPPGVSSVPTYWLLDADGKLLLKSEHWDEVARFLRGKLR